MPHLFWNPANRIKNFLLCGPWSPIFFKSHGWCFGQTFHWPAALSQMTRLKRQFHALRWKVHCGLWPPDQGQVWSCEIVALRSWGSLLRNGYFFALLCWYKTGIVVVAVLDVLFLVLPSGPSPIFHGKVLMLHKDAYDFNECKSMFVKTHLFAKLIALLPFRLWHDHNGTRLENRELADLDLLIFPSRSNIRRPVDSRKWSLATGAPGAEHSVHGTGPGAKSAGLQDLLIGSWSDLCREAAWHHPQLLVL